MRNAWFLAVIVACLVLAQSFAQQASKEKAKSQTLEQRVAALEQQIRELNDPEIQSDARHVEILGRLRDKAHRTFKWQSALYQQHEVEAFREAMAAVVYWNLEAKLALQKQDMDRASDCGLRAFYWADRWAKSLEALREQGYEPDPELLRDAHESVFLANQQLLRLEKIAETLGKDVGKLFNEREMRVKKIYGAANANNVKAKRIFFSALVNGKWLERINAADLNHIEALLSTLPDGHYRVEFEEEGTRRTVFDFDVKQDRLQKTSK